MPRDLTRLKEYKSSLQSKLAETLHISEDAAIHIVELLEQQDFLRLEAPLLDDKRVTTLIEKPHEIRTELGMRSDKPGNVLINAHLDWRDLAEFVCSSIGTVCGLTVGQPVVFWAAVCNSIISISRLLDIELDENKTAVIMAVQKCKKHGVYKVSEQECMDQANVILKECGYSEMDKTAYSNEVSRLIRYGCLDENDGKLELKEKIITHF